MTWGRGHPQKAITETSEQSSKWIWGSSARYPKNQHCTQFPQVNLKAHSQCNCHVNEHGWTQQMWKTNSQEYRQVLCRTLAWREGRVWKPIETEACVLNDSLIFSYSWGISHRARMTLCTVAFRGITQRINCDPVCMGKRTLRSYFIFTQKPDSRDKMRIKMQNK